MATTSNPTGVGSQDRTYTSAGAASVSGGTTPYLNVQKKNESKQLDPMQQWMYGLLAAQMDPAAKSELQVPGLTTATLQNLAANPDVAASRYLPSFAAPLLSAARSAHPQAMGDMNSLLLSAGSTDSPSARIASAQVRGDQQAREQQLLAKNYVPLTNQISANTANALKAGVAFPSANSLLLQTLAKYVGGITPASVQTDSIKVGSDERQSGF